MSRAIASIFIGLVLGATIAIRLALPGHAATSGRYAAFAGDYWLHDGRITIRPSGWGLFSYSYSYSCPHGVGSCRFAGYVGTAGKPGPYATFQLTSIQGNTAYGYVQTDSQPAFLALTMRVVHSSGLPNILLTLPDSAWKGCRLPLPSNYQSQCGA